MKAEATYVINVHQADKTALQKLITCDEIFIVGESIIVKNEDNIIGVFPSCMTSIVEKS